MAPIKIYLMKYTLDSLKKEKSKVTAQINKAMETYIHDFLITHIIKAKGVIN